MMDIVVPAWAERFPANSKIEVIEQGIQKESFFFPETERKFVIGRLPECDGTLNNIIVSKYHANIVYGKNNEEYPSFWIMDLGSQNKTKINKKLITSNVFYSIDEGDIVQIAHDQFSLFLYNKRLPSIKQEKPSLPIYIDNKLIQNESPNKTTCDFMIFENPMEMIRIYFDKKGLEPEYEIEQKGKQVIVRLSLTVYDEDGEELVAEASCSNKKSGTEKCALKACEIIAKNDTQFLNKAETSEQRKERELVENDYYEEEDDMFFDRSGEVERKRGARMKRRGIEKEEQIQTYQSLSAKLKLVQKDMLEFEGKIRKEKEQNNKADSEDEEDELDTYMKTIQSEVDGKVLKRYHDRLIELRKDEDDILRILPKLAPYNITDIQQKVNTPKIHQLVKKSSKKRVGQKKTFDKISDVKTCKKSQDQECEGNKYGEKEDYNEWLPPENQLGDGKTSLNSKLNY